MARVPYLTKADLAEADHDLLDEAINLRRALVNSPNCARAQGGLMRYIRHHSRLDPRLRELAILQVGYSSRSRYEYAHHLELALRFGVSKEDIRALAMDSSGGETALDPLAKTVLRAAREMVGDGQVSDATFAALQRSLDNERLVDLMVAIAFYLATVRLLASLRIDLEPEYQAYLDEFPLPPDP